MADSLSTTELNNLKYALDNGIVDMQHIERQISMSKRKEYLSAHPYEIWQGNNDYYYTYLPDPEKGRVQRKSKDRKKLEELIVKFRAQLEKSPLIEEVFTEWNERRKDLEQISKSTHYRNQVIFNRHFGEFGKRRIFDISVSDWCDFLEEQVSKHELTAKGFANLKGVTKGIINRARRRKLIHYSFEDIKMEISEDISLKKTYKDDRDEVFDEVETDTLMRYLKDNQDARNLAILLIFITGARIGEIATLKNEDIGENTITIRRTESEYMENHKKVYTVKEFPKTEAGNRTIVVPKSYEWLLKKIRLLNPFGEYVFTDGEKRLTAVQLRGRMKKVCKETGVKYRSPHKIRKTYVTILLDSKMDNKFIMDQVGHSDILTSETFYHRNRKTVLAKQEMLSKIGEFC